MVRRRAARRQLGFGGEESAGATFLRRDGRVWTTDKDGLILDLLAAEIAAVTGKDPGLHYDDLRAQFGTPYYTRVDAPATPAEKAALKKLDPAAVKAATLAGEPIVAKLTRAPGNGARSAASRSPRERLVRRAPVGHGERLQDLRREPDERRPPGGDPRGGAGDRQRRAGERRDVAPRLRPSLTSTSPEISTTTTRLGRLPIADGPPRPNRRIRWRPGSSLPRRHALTERRQPHLGSRYSRREPVISSAGSGKAASPSRSIRGTHESPMMCQPRAVVGRVVVGSERVADDGHPRRAQHERLTKQGHLLADSRP